MASMEEFLSTKVRMKSLVQQLREQLKWESEGATEWRSIEIKDLRSEITDLKEENEKLKTEKKKMKIEM